MFFNVEISCEAWKVNLDISSLAVASREESPGEPDSSRSKYAALDIADELANFSKRPEFSVSLFFWSPKYCADDIDFAFANFLCASWLSSGCALERPLLNDDLIGFPPNSEKKSLVDDGAATWIELEF